MKMRTEKEKQSGTISTLLGEDARIEGHLDFSGTLRLDGKLEGRMTGDNGILIVGEKAQVKADINVRKAVIMGEITGSVAALEKIELYPPARITGDICAPVITIESGAALNGKCIMQKPERAKVEAPDPEAKPSPPPTKPAAR
ncbi:MAG: polymer-forming cytoskeletal protein [Desulfosarcina sp.]|nr:polymer-forming cytoskeletal protein [Desulfobacterales bacterium]